MRNIIFHNVCRELTFDGLLRTAGSVSFWIATLNHETVDDPVEGQTVIEAVLSKFQKICHSDRSGIAVQLHLDGTVIFYLDLHMMLACCVNGFRGALCALLAAYRKNNDNCRHNDDKHDQNRRQDSCGLFVFLLHFY